MRKDRPFADDLPNGSVRPEAVLARAFAIEFTWADNVRWRAPLGLNDQEQEEQEHGRECNSRGAQSPLGRLGRQ